MPLDLRCTEVLQPMSHVGQSRHFDRAPLTSGLPLTPNMSPLRAH
jgi:hypothetical protein